MELRCFNEHRVSVLFWFSVNKPLDNESRDRCSILFLLAISEDNELTPAKNLSAFEKADPYI